MRKITFLLVLIVFSCLVSNAQDKSPAKFGKISPEDFAKKSYEIDASANAVVIADIGSTRMVNSGKGGFALEYETYRRVHILNKNGYDAGNVSIGLFTNEDMEEDLTSLKAVTYNLENDKVVETKLDTKSGVFKDKISKKTVLKKFTFPNIKEGSIIEYTYRIKSDFLFNLQPWDFQGDYPRLWSEYNVTMPEFYYYITLSQGYQPYFINNQKSRTENFTVSENRSAQASQSESFSAGVTDFKWAMKDVPALKEESYTSTLNNHISRLQFQMAEIRYPFNPRNIMGTWTQACETLLKDQDFGLAISRDNGWLGDIVDEAVGSAKNDLQKAQNIFSYVRDKVTCTGRNSIYLTQNLKSLLKSRNGNEAEINLLLTAMLRKANLTADPVLLSTRSHGFVYAMYPLMERFNYVISLLTIDGKDIYLDASFPTLAFGKLHYECYNGHARVINSIARPLDLRSDSLSEKSLTSVFLVHQKDGKFAGEVTAMPGYFSSMSLRERVKQKGAAQITEDLKKSFSSEVKISETTFDSLTRFDDPLTMKYRFEMETNDEDIIYLNPMMADALKENPFKSAERFYPVEMPYTEDDVYIMQVSVPDGYTLDELPKSIKVKLNEDNDGYFEYIISQSNGVISLRSRLQMKRSTFLPEEYETLREFYNLIVKKHSEQIVFKKK